MTLLQSGDVRIQLLTVRLFKRVLPPQNPELLEIQKGKNFLPIFFEIVGSINCLSSEFESLDHQFPIVASLVASMASGTSFQLLQESGTSRLALSHPFFPLSNPGF